MLILETRFESTFNCVQFLIPRKLPFQNQKGNYQIFLFRKLRLDIFFQQRMGTRTHDKTGFFLFYLQIIGSSLASREGRGRLRCSLRSR